MAALFSPVFLLFSAIVSSVKITCKSAHWPLTKKSCELSHHTQLAHPSGGLKYDHQFFIESTADVDLPPELAAMWNVSLRSARTDAWRCSHEHKCSVFVLLPHDPSQYGSAGSNYYVFHVDILLPVWNHINFKMSCGAGAGMKDISVFVFHMQSNRILWDSDIFRSSDTFWTQSFRLLFGDNFKPFTLDSFRSLHDRDVAAAVATEGTAGMSSPLLCFHTVSLGVPEFSSPSKKAVQSMAQLMRQVGRVCSEAMPVIDIIISHAQ